MEKDTAAVKAIIEQIEADPWGRYKTDREIAAMVGRTVSRVSQIRREIRQKKSGAATISSIGCKTSTIPKAPKTRQETSKPASACTSGHQESTIEETGSKPLVDKGGWEIPEHLQEVFKQREILTGIIRQVELINGEIKRLIESNNPVAAYLNPIAYREAYRNYHSQLRFAVPWAVCRYCKGNADARKNCRCCKGAGWVNESLYHLTPEALKHQKQDGKCPHLQQVARLDVKYPQSQQTALLSRKCNIGAVESPETPYRSGRVCQKARHSEKTNKPKTRREMSGATTSCNIGGRTSAIPEAPEKERKPLLLAEPPT